MALKDKELSGDVYSSFQCITYVTSYDLGPLSVYQTVQQHSRQCSILAFLFKQIPINAMESGGLLCYL